MKFGVYEEGHEIDITIEAETLEKAKEILERQSEEVTFDITELRVVPLCPECGVGLTTVLFKEEGYLDVNDDGSYSDGGQTSGEYVCPMCGKAIGGYGQQAWGFLPNFG